MVYLVTFRTKCFSAVWKAHKEFRKLAVRQSRPHIETYLGEYGDKATVKGIYRKWIVLESMLNGENIFRSIEDRDFYE
jgi:hypothetical protein